MVTLYELYEFQWTDAKIKILLAEMQTYAESFTTPLNKQVWKNIAASINSYGYNLTADNCYIKWTGMKKKYKTIKDNEKSNWYSKTWEYFDIIDDMLEKNPAIAPLSITSTICDFTINKHCNSSDEENEKENELNVESTNILQNRDIRRRKSKTKV
ncbi:hypothetical protein P5V15_011418 [Pogonomyrmex californicus]